MFKVKKFVDLSWDVTKDSPIYPGDPEPSVTVATTLENDGYNLFTVVTGTQTGTHVDAPYHFRNDGATIDQMELDFFIGLFIGHPNNHSFSDEEIQFHLINAVSYTHLRRRRCIDTR